MQRPTTLRTLYIDFDAFFANVEKQLDPTLHHRPVGVAPLDSEYSSLIACCYTAKTHGIKRGTRVKDARQILPSMEIRTARHEVYVDMHHRIVNVVEQFLPVQKSWSIDEVECSLVFLSDEKSIETAYKIRDALTAQIGPYITPSIGLSSNVLLAKIAAEMQKPRGFIVLHPNDLPGRLLDVPLSDIPGVARAMTSRLARANITTMEDLYHTSAKHARALWGNVEGERIWSQLHGYPIVRPPTQRRMYGHSRILSGAWKSREKARTCLRLLTAKATRRLRADGYLATRITVSLKTEYDERLSQEIQSDPARDDFTWLGLMDQGFTACLSRTRAKSIARVSVMLHGLTRTQQVTPDLFDDPALRLKRQKCDNLSDIMDRMNAKYKSDILHLGLREQPPGGYAGAKIAFGRIPAKEDFAAPNFKTMKRGVP